MFNQVLRLSKHSIVYGLGTAVSQIVGFFLIPVYTRYLTPANYGALEIFQTTLSVLSIILIMGLSTALFRSYYLYNDESKRKTVVSTAFLFLTVSSVIITGILIVLASNISSLFFDSGEYTTYFRLIFLTLLCDIGIMIIMSVFRAREESTKYAMVIVLRVVLSVSLNITFLVAMHRGVLGILEGNLITVAFLYCILLASVIRKAGLRFSVDELKSMLAFGLPLVPAGLGSWILTLSDRYFLQFLSTSTELGLYSLGYKFGMVINALIVGPFQLAWMPFIFSISKRENAREVYSRVFTYFLLVAVIAALAISVLSGEVIATMATPEFQSAYNVIPLIAMSYVLFGCYFVFMVGINLEAKTKYLMPIVVGAAILNLGLNYLLIPDYGRMGAAIATLISYSTLPFSCYLVSHHYYPVKYEWGRVIKILLAAGIIYAGSLFITDTYDVVHSYKIVGLLKVLALMTYPVILYLFRFYHPAEIQKVRELVRSAPTRIRKKLGR